MADIVNDRVNTAQAELLKRAKKLESIVKQARGGRGETVTARLRYRLSRLLVFEPATFVVGCELWPRTKNKNATWASATLR